jgi:DcaP outer membrane protein
MSKIKPIAAALLTVGVVSSIAPVAAGVTEDRISELERQLAELKAIVSGNQENISTNQIEIEEARPSKKGTKFQYGGFIQLDTISTNYGEGKPGNELIEDFLVASLIPVEPVSGKSDSYSSTNMHAKTSRFFFTTKTNTDAGTISSRIELDFVLSAQGDERISNSWSSRIRHAFVNWDYDEGQSLMAGQSWSTFFNVAALPDVLDFVGPVGTLFNRQPQIRWTSGGLQLAVEAPATRLNRDAGGALSTGYDDYHEGIPDLVARYNSKVGDLSWSIAGIARELTYEDRVSSAIEGASDEQFGYGLSFSGKWGLGTNDIRFMLNYGDALGRYMGLNAFNDGYVDANGDIETVDQWGGLVAYRHFWTPKWRSTFSLSASEADNPGVGDFVHANSLAKSYQSFHANLNYLPAPKMSIGGEYLYAKKEMEDGREGDLNRLQFSVKYAF